MENKYYTPEIEEFHVGFEYEVKMYKKDEWIKRKWTELNVMSAEFNIDFRRAYDLPKVTVPDIVRVKYLDRSDIESLGWEYDDIWRDGGTSLFKKGNDMLAFYGTNRLPNNPLRVRILKDSKQDKHLFDGTIKNKSELKRLLKQLGI